MANKKTPSREANIAALKEQDPTHALELIAAEVGEPQRGSLDAILAGTSDADLVKVGTTILSGRIVTDAARLYPTAWDFFQGATEAQKRMLRGFSIPLLALAVHQALELQQMDAHRADRSSSEGVTRAAQEKAAQAALTAAVALRDQAFDALRDAAGRSEALRAQVVAAVGTAATSATLARGLDALAKTLRGWLGGKDKALLGRLALANVDAAYATELESAAKTVRSSAAHAARRPPSGKVTQGALDRADGINVLLLGQIIRAFEGAHGIDPTIPRLVPISTRRLFSRSTRKKKVEEPTSGNEPDSGDEELTNGDEPEGTDE